MYSKYREQDLKHIQVRKGSRLQSVWFAEVSLNTGSGNSYNKLP